MNISDRIIKAIEVSAIAHQGQTRKGSNTPYISHPYAVALICQHYNDDEDIFIGALLHDVLEDVSPDIYSADDIRNTFGENVLDLVKGVSEKKTDNNKDIPWEERKIAYIRNLKDIASEGSIIISAADKIHNLKSILSEYEIIGDKIWERFNSKPNEQLWFYGSIADVVEERMPKSLVSSELKSHVDKLKVII
ncbi:MAG: HD domain-containing protein [Candidatus Saccharibacteria bacterium]